MAAALVPLQGFRGAEECISGDRFSGDVRCIMDLGDYRTEGLTPGMHYELMKLFADRADFNAIVEDNPDKADAIDQLAFNMQKVIEDEELRENMITDGIVWAKDFNWEETVNQTLATIL